jgi:2-polyprenyl-3-methyl-5-hydroxy-6-metoxy-1,4-benzoquinol methylase
MNKYVKITDPSFDKFEDWNFKELRWYSRPYEYHAMKKTVSELGENLSVLDAACGFKTPGYKMLASLDNVDSVTALDLGKGYAKNFINNGIDHPKVNKIIGDLTKWSPDKEYDVVVCISSLEHIRKFKKAIKTMYDSLKQGGHLFITFDISRNGKRNKFLANSKLSPLDYKKAFEEVGFQLVGEFDDTEYEDIISGANTLYGPSIHENLMCFKFLMKK